MDQEWKSNVKGSPDQSWFGVHVMVNSSRDGQALLQVLPDLQKLGINVLVAEVDYNFAYQSHPELRGTDPLQPVEARALAQLCRQLGIRLIPQFQCLGHQSWAEHTHPLLARYPQFDETPGKFPGNSGIYCRSWCPRHPDLNPILFSLFKELIEAFEADALHVGMDEVFIIASVHCSRCQGSQPADIFAEAVNTYYDFLAKQCKVEMLMWGDRLLDAHETGYGKWEAAENGTHTALEQIPRDIILCDWHYTRRAGYPSIPIFSGKGFRVWPGSWKDVDASLALLGYSLQNGGDQMLGHLCTTWGAVPIDKLVEWEPIQAISRSLKI